MPKLAKPMTAAQVQRLTTRKHRHRTMYAVGGVPGLYLQIVPPHGASWILRRMIDGRRRDVGLGSAREVTLDQARARAQEHEA